MGEKEKLYVELKNILGRQPGPEVAEQLSVYQTNLKQKVVQMKAMNSELDMYKQQVEEFRCDISDVVGEQEKIKQQWVATKSKQRTDEESSFVVGSTTQEIVPQGLADSTSNQPP